MDNERVYYSHEAEIHAMRETARLMVLCLMVGLGIGAALTLLFAPTPSKKIRENLTKMVGQRWDNGRETIEPMVKRIEKEFDGLQKTVEEHLK